MIWLANNWRMLLWFVLAACVVLTGSAASYYHNRMKQAQANVTIAQQGQQQAEAITDNVITAVTLFNDIARATHDDKQQNSSESDRRVVYIREAVKSDTCAAQRVPAAAADRLREHRDKIRSGAGSTDTGRTAG
jgi:prophage endopeptidase